MPIDTSLYPANWSDIACAVKEGAEWKCEECGRDCLHLGENLLSFARRVMFTRQPGAGLITMRNLQPIFSHPKRWELQACHLDQNPKNNAPGNLKALCTGCHRKLDNGRSQVAQRQYLADERNGQLCLF